MILSLTKLQEEAINRWKEHPAVKKAIKNEGRVAIIWGPSTGIGLPVTVTVRDKDGVTISTDITDYESW